VSRGFDARLAELGITLPAVFPPAGNYLGCKRAGDLLYVGGHGPVGSEGIKRGDRLHPPKPDMHGKLPWRRSPGL